MRLHGSLIRIMTEKLKIDVKKAIASQVIVPFL